MVDFRRGRDSGRESSREDTRGSSSGRDRESSRDSGRDRESSRDSGRDRESSRDSGRGGRDTGRGGGRASAYVYQKRTADSVNKRSSMGGKDFDMILKDTVKAWKVNDGANTIRVVPPTWPDAEHYGYDIWVHYGIGPDEQAYLCPHKMKGEPCPICEEHGRARKAGEHEDYVKSLEPTRRVLVYLVDRDNEKEGIQAWAAPWTIDRDITKVSVDRRTNEVLSVDDPEDGFDIEFDRTGKGIGTKYVGLAIARRSSPLGKSEWLDAAIDLPLPDALNYYDYDYIQKVFGGGGSHSTRSDRDSRESRDDRGRDSRDEPSRDSRDTGRSAGRGREEPELPTFEAVMEMTGDELDAVVSEFNLKDIDPNKADSDAQLAEWICEDLKLKPSSRGRNDRDENEGRETLRRMRGDR